MSVGSQSAATSKKMLWAGRILSGLVAAMILMSAVMKFMMTTDAQKDLGSYRLELAGRQDRAGRY